MHPAVVLQTGPCLTLGLPASLEKLWVLNLPIKMQEQSLNRYFSMPCSRPANGGRTRNLPAHDVKGGAAQIYCKQDVIKRAILHRLQCIQCRKIRLWEPDQRINDYGVRSTKASGNRHHRDENYQKKLMKEAVHLTRLKPQQPGSVKKVATKQTRHQSG